jgi:hypothetical protein
LVHELGICNELLSVLVLVALATVLHVLECDGILYHILVRGGILFGHLVVEDSMLVHSPHFVKDHHEDLVQGLVTRLLAFALALVVHTRLDLVIEVFFAETERFESRLRAYGLFLQLGFLLPLALASGLSKFSKSATVAGAVWLEVTALRIVILTTHFVIFDVFVSVAILRIASAF